MCKAVVIIKQFREFKSCAEIRSWVGIKPGTPSLKYPAKTLAPGSDVKAWGNTRGYAGEADETERLRADSEFGVKAWRGVTVVGD
jgi:hypothetical protein